MTDKEFTIRAFKCRMDETKERPFIECMVCPYGEKIDPDVDSVENMKCDLLKLYADIGTLLIESK